MIQFDSVLQAFDYMFGDNKITKLSMPGSIYPWFYVDEIRKAIGYNSDNNQLTRYMDHRDEYLAVLHVSELPVNLTEGSKCINNGLNKHTSSVMIISLPGVFELLRHIRASENNRVGEFWYWMNNTILPQLYYNPQIIQELNRLQAEKIELQQKANLNLMTIPVDKSFGLAKKYEDLKRYTIANQEYINLGQMVSVSECDITIDMLAHILTSHGYPTGTIRMYEELRNDGFLCKFREKYNHPTQQAINDGILKWGVFQNSNNQPIYVVLITSYGQKVLINHYISKFNYYTENDININLRSDPNPVL